MASVHQNPPAVHSAPDQCPESARRGFPGGRLCHVTFNTRSEWCPACRAPRPVRPAQLPMADFVDQVAARVEAEGDDFGPWLAEKLRELSGEARFLRAETPAEFDARSELWGEWSAETRVRAEAEIDF